MSFVTGRNCQAIFMLFVASLVASPSALASDQYGKVTVTFGDTYGGPFAFTISGTRSAKPACAADDAWAIPTSSTENARGVLSMILTAFAAGKTVNVHGTGTCDPGAPTREAVSYIFLQ